MDHDRRRRAAQRSFFSLFPHQELEGGVLAIVSPDTPDRSIFNSVVYEEPAAVSAAWEHLEGIYTDAGVRAWTVWVGSEDRELAWALAGHGHHLDAAPEVMAADLMDMDLEGPDLGEPVSWEELAAVNEAAYGLNEGEFRPVTRLPAGSAHCIGVPGKAVVGVHDAGGDAWVLFVATRPDEQGQGLSSALMRQALRAARDRGCTTTSLEASAAGRPVYERLGYRPLGAVEMWERRS